VEQAYARVRREALRQAVMTTGVDDLLGAGLASKSLKHSSHSLSFHSGKSGSNSPKPPLMALNAFTVWGGAKHTHETYFKLHGYPDWWYELQAQKCRHGNGGNIKQAAVVTAEPYMSLIQAAKTSSDNTGQAAVAAIDLHSGNAQLGSNQEADCNDWIFDSEATNHMTFDVTDFSQQSPPRRTSIVNANEDISSVTGARTVMISPALSLSHTLLMPFFISQTIVRESDY